MKYLGTNYHVWQLNGIDSGERNEGKADKADVPWAVMFAARREVMGSLLVTRPSVITYLKFGLTPEV